MNRRFNINLLNETSSNKVISRGLTRKELTTCKGLKVPKETKGWLEWDGIRLSFELDEPIEYSNQVGSLYRIDYYKVGRKVKKEILTYEASNQERIEYVVKHINILRDVNGLKRVNPNNIRFCLNMALESGMDLDKALQTYLEDIEIQSANKR